MTVLPGSNCCFCTYYLQTWGNDGLAVSSLEMLLCYCTTTQETLLLHYGSMINLCSLSSLLPSPFTPFWRGLEQQLINHKGKRVRRKTQPTVPSFQLQISKAEASLTWERHVTLKFWWTLCLKHDLMWKKDLCSWKKEVSQGTHIACMVPGLVYSTNVHIAAENVMMPNNNLREKKF